MTDGLSEQQFVVIGAGVMGHGIAQVAAMAGYQTTLTDANEAAAGKYRSRAKTYAREWLDYAKASGQDKSKPMKYCASASGNKEYCPG